MAALVTLGSPDDTATPPAVNVADDRITVTWADGTVDLVPRTSEVAR